MFRRKIIEPVPAGRPTSVERKIFPVLLDRGTSVYGHIDYIYWRDMGIPSDFVRGSSDLIRGIAPSPLLEGKHGEALVDESASVGGGAFLYGGSVVGRGAEIGAGARIDQSVISDGVRIGAGAVIERSVIVDGADIGPRVVISDVIIGEGAVVGARCELINGIRVWPGV